MLTRRILVTVQLLILPALSQPPTCRTDTIIANYSQVICNNQPVTIGQTCNVTCNPGHYFQANQTSVTYTCVGENEWSPEMMVTACEVISEQSKEQETQGPNWIVISIVIVSITAIVIIIAIVFIFFKKRRQARKRKQNLKDVEEDLLVELKNLKDSTKGEGHSILTSVENYWRQCIKTWYPEFHSRSYFLPPVHLNQKKNNIADQPHYDRAPFVLHGMQALVDNGHVEDVMFVLSQLQFGNYFGKPCFAPAVDLLSRPRTLPEDLRKQLFDKDDFDILIIHREHGLFTLQISSVTNQEKTALRKKVKEVINQLNKSVVVLKHLTSDLETEINITKCLVLPNITSGQLKRAIKRCSSTGQCFGAKNVDDAVKLCLLKDQLPMDEMSSGTYISSLHPLREWWQRVKASISTSGSSLTSSLYEQLVARFCGPATTVEVYCFTAPRLNIRTLGEAMYETGERMARLVLVPQQVDILNQSPPFAFLSGPSGTGKTIVLVMQGLTWIQRGYDIHVVSTCYESRAVTLVIEHQLRKTPITPTDGSHVYKHQFDLRKDSQVGTAVTRLKYLSAKRQMCVIADEVVRDDRESFTKFCDQLIENELRVFIWGASVFSDFKPSYLVNFELTTPLRSPPFVKEVMEGKEIQDKEVIHDYTVSDVPPVMRIKHCDDHTGPWPLNCVECGHEIARVLRTLDVGRTGDSNGPPPLQYRDVLVFCDYHTDGQVDRNGQMITTASGLVRGLIERHVPVRVVKKDDEAAICDMALGVSDRVTVTWWKDVRGLERRVVVVESGLDWYNKFQAISRCTSQLVLIDR